MSQLINPGVALSQDHVFHNVNGSRTIPSAQCSSVNLSQGDLFPMLHCIMHNVGKVDKVKDEKGEKASCDKLTMRGRRFSKSLFYAIFPKTYLCFPSQFVAAGTKYRIGLTNLLLCPVFPFSRFTLCNGPPGHDSRLHCAEGMALDHVTLWNSDSATMRRPG